MFGRGREALRSLTTDRLVRYWRGIPKVPLAFLGVGMHRAWFELVFTMPRAAEVESASAYVVSQGLLDLVMVSTLFVFAALSRRVSPLHERRAAWATCGGCLISSTLTAYLGVFEPALFQLARVLSSAVGGVGIGLAVLLWSERYAMLAPARICLYYSCGIVFGALVVWAFRGLLPPWQPTMICLLPLASLWMLWRSYHRHRVDEASSCREWGRFSFPWKPLAMVALYSLAFSMQYHAAAVPGLHSSLGTIACALFVAALVGLAGARVEFESVYSFWLPVMAAAFLLIPASGALGQWWSAFFNCWGHTCSEIFVLVMMGSLARRYAVSPIWLFGIERGVRSLALLVGRVIGQAIILQGGSTSLPVIIAVILATVVILTETKLDARWGLALRPVRQGGNDEGEQGGTGETANTDAERLNCLGTRCTELAHSHGLTQREGEVLLLLAQRKSTADIEDELIIANGTAKAHINHVYQKLGVHSREELLDLIGDEKM
jgi:DNA-binding CsgD family transcriptional regulator